LEDGNDPAPLQYARTRLSHRWFVDGTASPSTRK
jgi:hypothetical protein